MSRELKIRKEKQDTNCVRMQVADAREKLEKCDATLNDDYVIYRRGRRATVLPTGTRT